MLMVTDYKGHSQKPSCLSVKLISTGDQLIRLINQPFVHA